MNDMNQTLQNSKVDREKALALDRRELLDATVPEKALDLDRRAPLSR